MRSAILVHEPSAHEAPKDEASSLSKLALSAGSTAGSYEREGCRLAEGGGVNLYRSAG